MDDTRSTTRSVPCKVSLVLSTPFLRQGLERPTVYHFFNCGYLYDTTVQYKFLSTVPTTETPVLLNSSLFTSSSFTTPVDPLPIRTVSLVVHVSETHSVSTRTEQTPSRSPGLTRRTVEVESPSQPTLPSPPPCPNLRRGRNEREEGGGGGRPVEKRPPVSTHEQNSRGQEGDEEVCERHPCPSQPGAEGRRAHPVVTRPDRTSPSLSPG